ncbi:MAG TPA: MBL fold metallo-hydrolase [Pirellulales bacterium]|nr:MBL fold metallo-hydrolase [Pirellulales bacterium]
MNHLRDGQLRVHLLDMGLERYGDCVLCQYGGTNVLIDGGHQHDISGRGGYPSIPDQLQQVLGHGPPFEISLLVVTHCHTDHIGCLPEMVEHDMLDLKWALVADENLGFGHAPGEIGPLDAADVSPTARRVVAALREESRMGVADADLQQFLADAPSLEPRYRKMLAKLERRLGQQMLRYRGDKLPNLEKAFREIGLRILGPSQDQLLLCAEAIEQLTRDGIEAVRQLSEGEDRDDLSAVDGLALYRSLVASPLGDASDRPGRGAALNNQSIVVTLDAAEARVLLAGDMQFANAELRGLDAEMNALRKVVADEAKRGAFDFVKISHHASYNGFDESVFRDLNGSVRFGISGGLRDAKHPDPAVLTLLKRLRRNDDSVTWARTDRNGLITVTFGAGQQITFSRGGRLNIGAPNKDDAGLPAAPVSAGTTASSLPAAPPAEPPVGTTARASVPENEFAVEPARVSASFPYAGTRVSLTIELEPLAGRRVKGDIGADWKLAGGRRLPKLLFVTSREALHRNLGQHEADDILDRVAGAGHAVLDTLPAGATDPNQVLHLVRPSLNSDTAGVVLVGGYDVVPAHRLDALDSSLRAAVRHRDGDPYDDFLVWSDSIYGDRDGDGMAELPVSRVPDAKTPELVVRAMQAGGSAAVQLGGVQNRNRPYAARIYGSIPGAGAANFIESEAARPGDPRYANGVLSSSAVYLMLHGDFQDSQRFWGETDREIPYEAMNISDVTPVANRVVFCGACWGALTVMERAIDVVPPALISPRAVNASIALSFLNAGARAFVGCTGAHYSPDGNDTSYYGAPLHSAFWRHFILGFPPAEALFQAKTDYLGGIPHRRTRDPVDKARELKILRQFTCLGLGW